MQSSLSSYPEPNHQKVIVPSIPNFHHDVIIPIIYANENFDVLANNSYPSVPQRKAVAIKKQRVQAVIETIVSKKNI